MAETKTSARLAVGKKAASRPRRRRKIRGLTWEDGLRAFLLTGGLLLITAALLGFVLSQVAASIEARGVVPLESGEGPSVKASPPGSAGAGPAALASRPISASPTALARQPTPAAGEGLFVAASPSGTAGGSAESGPGAPASSPAGASPSALAPQPAPLGVGEGPSVEASSPGSGGADPVALASRPTGARSGVPARGTLMFLIDDAGNNLWELEPFLRFPGPLSIAVLPGLPYSAEAARRIRAAGKEVFLHQPMEALGGQNPGPGAIYAGMSPVEVRGVIERNLAEIGPVAGMNNHQGSRITEDGEIMEIVLSLCQERGIFFVDSRTTVASKAPAVAGKLGMKIGARDVFLDNEPERSSIIGYLEGGISLAERRGSALMIGHTWSGELAPALEEFYPKLLERGFVFFTASRFLEAQR